MQNIKTRINCIGSSTRNSLDVRIRWVDMVMSFEGLDCADTTGDAILSAFHELGAPPLCFDVCFSQGYLKHLKFSISGSLIMVFSFAPSSPPDTTSYLDSALIDASQ
ncbi:hypothetical protein TMatcc_009436 [Talaromyces marneffei ATCC 18224]